MVLQAPTMKLFVILLSGVALCNSSAIPKDNSHYIDGVSRYIWMTHDDSELVLVDLHESTDKLLNNEGDRNEYWLYTRENPDEYQLLVNGDVESLVNSNYKADRPTYFLAHGWGNSGESRCNLVQRTALLASLDCNVIVVDWRHDAAGLYTVAVMNVPRAGVALGRFVDWLIAASNGDWNSISMNGYSLGAHVIGNAGRTVGGRVARLIGLDPAGPLWQLNDNRLKENDAQYVEGIHTDGGIQGILNPVGDVDFYPNGGRNQPGCDDSGCNHKRSYELFASSAISGHLVGKRCSNLLQATTNNCSGSELHLGTVDLNKKGSGLYGLRTLDAWPY